MNQHYPLSRAAERDAAQLEMVEWIRQRTEDGIKNELAYVRFACDIERLVREPDPEGRLGLPLAELTFEEREEVCALGLDETFAGYIAQELPLYREHRAHHTLCGHRAHQVREVRKTVEGVRAGTASLLERIEEWKAPPDASARKRLRERILEPLAQALFPESQTPEGDAIAEILERLHDLRGLLANTILPRLARLQAKIELAQAAAPDPWKIPCAEALTIVIPLLEPLTENVRRGHPHHETWGKDPHAHAAFEHVEYCPRAGCHTLGVFFGHAFDGTVARNDAASFRSALKRAKTFLRTSKQKQVVSS